MNTYFNIELAEMAIKHIYHGLYRGQFFHQFEYGALRFERNGYVCERHHNIIGWCVFFGDRNFYEAEASKAKRHGQRELGQNPAIFLNSKAIEERGIELLLGSNPSENYYYQELIANCLMGNGIIVEFQRMVERVKKGLNQPIDTYFNTELAQQVIDYIENGLQKHQFLNTEIWGTMSLNEKNNIDKISHDLAGWTCYLGNHKHYEETVEKARSRFERKKILNEDTFVFGGGFRSIAIELLLGKKYYINKFYWDLVEILIKSKAKALDDFKQLLELGLFTN